MRGLQHFPAGPQQGIGGEQAGLDGRAPGFHRGVAFVGDGVPVVVVVQFSVLPFQHVAQFREPGALALDSLAQGFPGQPGGAEPDEGGRGGDVSLRGDEEAGGAPEVGKRVGGFGNPSCDAVRVRSASISLDEGIRQCQAQRVALRERDGVAAPAFDEAYAAQLARQGAGKEQQERQRCACDEDSGLEADVSRAAFLAASSSGSPDFGGRCGGCHVVDGDCMSG